MRQQGEQTNYPGIYKLSDGSFRVVATGKNPKTGKKDFIERLTREKDAQMTINEAVEWRAQLVQQIRTGGPQANMVALPRILELCEDASWITFLADDIESERSAERVESLIDNHIIPRWGSYFFNKVEVAEINGWVRQLEKSLGAGSVRQIASVLRRIISQARGERGLPGLDWDFVRLPPVGTSHAEKNRLTEEQIASVLPVVLNRHPFYAPVIFSLYSTGLRFGHTVALMYAKMSVDGVVKVDQGYDDKKNAFKPINKRKNVPAEIGFEPFTLELIRQHRRWLMRKDHDGLQTGLLFPSARGDRPIGNDQLNDIWREAQVAAGIEKPVTIHGLRHTFHDIARQQGVPDAVVKTMSGRAGTEVIRERGKGTHLHYSRGVTVEEMRQASIAVMRIIPTGPVGTASRDSGRDQGIVTEGMDASSPSVRLVQK